VIQTVRRALALAAAGLAVAAPAHASINDCQTGRACLRRRHFKAGTIAIAGIAAMLAVAAAEPASAAPVAGHSTATTVSPAFAGEHLSAAGSLYCLVNRAAAGETPVVQSTCSSQFADQFWSLDQAAGYPANYVHIRNTYTNKCIVTRGTGDSAAVATGCANFPDQIWWAPFSGGYRVFHNVNSGKCLTSRTNAEGRPFQSAPCDDANLLQLWEQF
jgi:ricin-type beta-trefoil lectin protein